MSTVSQPFIAVSLNHLQRVPAVNIETSFLISLQGYLGICGTTLIALIQGCQIVELHTSKQKL